jgi:hypothetical protein
MTFSSAPISKSLGYRTVKITFGFSLNARFF